MTTLDDYILRFQRLRTDKERERCSALKYDRPGKYRILVKVIDIFGNDTSQAFHAEVA